MAVHLCVDCAALPLDKQPRVPRKIAGGGPRSQRCTTHLREKKRREKEARRYAHVARTYGLTPEQYLALLEYQDYRCAICRIANGKTKALAVDHDHALARTHDHPEDKACYLCVRGLVCGPDNQHVIDRLGISQLQNAIDYKTEPPFVRMRREGLV